MFPHDHVWLINGIVIVSVLADIWYLFTVRKLNRRLKRLKDDKPYIKHLEDTIKEHEKINTRQNKLLKDDHYKPT